MADTSNLRIITPFGELAYKNAAGLSIQLSRIVDDFQDISNRFQDFSYTFELPFLKANSLVFGAPETKGSKNYFNRNQSIDCQVYLNNTLLLDGLINLETITQSGYNCKFYSKFKELIDTIEEQNPDGSDKTLKDLKFPVVSGWSYEDSIVFHQAQNYKNSDETFYQYPLSHYSTFYTQSGLYSGMTDYMTRPPYNYAMRDDDTYQNFYYLINSRLTGNNVYFNRFYIHQIPPCVYVVSIVKQILTDAGWRLGGQFFNGESIKKVVLTYAGDDDIYDQATQQVSGSTDLNLQIAKFLPDTSQADFLKDIINMFNLYIKVDVTNKIVSFETYNTVFGDSFNPYDITNKIDSKTVNFSYVENNDPTIQFEKANNQLVMGDNKIMDDLDDNATTQSWAKISNINYYSFFNRKGTTDEISLKFSEPNVQRVFIYNDINIYGQFKYAGIQSAYLPCLTKQTPTDNDSKKFNKASGDTYLMNSEDTIKFAGKGSLMFYYGLPTTSFENVPGMGPLSDYMYFNMPTYSGTTITRVPIAVMSPFQLFNYRDILEDWLNNLNTNRYSDRRTTAATYLQTLWHMMGRNVNLADTYLTDFSLVFDDNGYFHNTLWTTFHKYKYDTYKYSELLTASMRMNEIDWQEMQIERPIMYNNEIYSLVSIDGYNPIEKKCTLKLIKKL